jgi:hypothetical protein
MNVEIALATSDYFHINSIPHNIGEFTETPMIDNLITEWVGSEHLQTAKEIIAYCCYNNYTIHRAFVFIGGGSNGKSTFMQLIENFIGSNNICSTSERSNGLAALYNGLKRCCTLWHGICVQQLGCGF